MSWIGPILNITDKVMSRFNWDRKSIRRNKIKKIEREINALLKDYSPKNAARIARLRKQLRLLKEQAQND